MLKYLSIDGGVLSNKTIPPTCKIMIAYIGNLQKANKYFFGTHAYMSETLGIRFDYFEKQMSKLLEQKIFIVTDHGITLGFDTDHIAETEWKLGV